MLTRGPFGFRLPGWLRQSCSLRPYTRSKSKYSTCTRVAATDYILCDNASLTSQAYQTLRSAPYLIVDTEGHTRSSSNQPTSNLSLIQIGTPGASRVFLFDFLALDSNARRHILALLADSRIPKIGWGLPADVEILFNGYGTQMTSFLDLQIVDIQSRLERGERECQRLKRLAWKRVPAESLKELELDGIHALNKMDNALHEHEISGVPMKECQCDYFHSVGSY